MRLIQLEDLPHPRRLFVIHNQTPTCRIDIIAERRRASDPFPLPPRCRHLIPSAFADDLTFKLCKRQKDVQSKAPKRRRGIELLRYRHEARRALIEAINE